MQVMVMDMTDDFDRLRPLFERWRPDAEPGSGALNIPLEMETMLATARQLAESPQAEFLVLVDCCLNFRGCMGLRFTPSHVGPGLFAHECLFFVDPACRGAGLHLIQASRQIARSRNCSGRFLTASRVASENGFDRTCQLYDRLGLHQVEATYFEAL